MPSSGSVCFAPVAVANSTPQPAFSPRSRPVSLSITAACFATLSPTARSAATAAA